MTKSQARAIEEIKRECAKRSERYVAVFCEPQDCGSFVELRGALLYHREGQTPRGYDERFDSLNDSTFQAFIGKRGRVTGTIRQCLGGEHVFTSKNLYKLSIY